MSEYALVSEVYGWSGNKKKKKKRIKENREYITPLSPSEMDKELLKDSDKTIFNQSIQPELKLKNMGISPYTDNDTEYQSVYGIDYNSLNENTVNLKNQGSQDMQDMQGPAMNPTRSHVDRFNDPEYQEFLEFKRLKQSKATNPPRSGESGGSGESVVQRIIPESLKTIIDPGDQFNELLLYIFTGFFLLMIYDNIYKLGKDSY